MAFIFDEKAFRKESEEFYSTYPEDVSDIEKGLDERYRENNVSAMVQKKWTYETVSRSCDVKIFRYCPFYSEIITGRERNSVAGAFPPIPGLGCWALRTHYPVAEFDEWRKPYVDKDLIFAEMMTDHSHHYADVEYVLNVGFERIREKAREAQPADREEEEFLDAVISACDAAILVGERFSEKAGEMLETEEDPAVRENLQRIQKTACRVPRYPAETFYEALCSVWFTRELCTSMEGSGFAVMGHYDRLLEPYYEQDIKNGTLTEEEAQELIDCMMLITDARWKHVSATSGTNASVVIGGCDGEGSLIFNDVTKLILNTFLKYETSSPKLQVRLSHGHPDEFIKKTAQIAALGRNTLTILNDDVLIEAHHKAGKEVCDCRLYLAGGCQEPVLSNECNSRAFMYLNLPQFLNAVLFPDEFELWEQENIEPGKTDGVSDFTELYDHVIYNFSRFMDALAGHYRRFEQIWSEINPMPLFSATMKECMDRKKDITKGGARYNSSSFSLVGIGTFIDSLFAIKKAVFDSGIFSMEEMKECIRSDFKDREETRLYLLNKIPKYGQSDPELEDFTVRVFHDLAEHSSGMPNARGGYFEASLFAFFFYDVLKDRTWATADGRHFGGRISRGCNPCETTQGVDIASLLYSLKKIDFTDYPGVAVSYMEMPAAKTRCEEGIFADILRAFIHCGGSALDFNVVDKEQLLRAKEDPESYRNLIVRVCGYSAPFISLSEDLQDEVIQRTMRTS